VPNVCRGLVLLAHGKRQVYPVPEFTHTAKPWAHGNPAVSGSEEYRIALVQVLTWHGIHLLIMLIVVLDVLEMIILEGTNMSHQRCHFPNLMVWSPHLERQVCDYFQIFSIAEHMWATSASLHMEGKAATWLQVYKLKHGLGNWEIFIEAVEDKFG